MKNKENIEKKLSELIPLGKGISKEEALKLEKIGVMVQQNILMVVAKSEEAKVLIAPFVSDIEKVPELSYVANTKNTIKSIFNPLKLKKTMDFFSEFDESVKVSLLMEYPITISNSHFSVIIAPRIEDSESEPTGAELKEKKKEPKEIEELQKEYQLRWKEIRNRTNKNIQVQIEQLLALDQEIGNIMGDLNPSP